jgi:transposase
MQNTPISTVKTSQKTTPLAMAELLKIKDREIVNLRRQVAWFQHKIFGQKSERRLPEPEGVQDTLDKAFAATPEVPVQNKKTLIASHVGTSKPKPVDGKDESALFFDDKKVPVQVIAVTNPEIDGLNPADYEVIDSSRADVSFIAGIKVSRAWLTKLVFSSVSLFEPIYDALLDSIRSSRVKAMDEAPIKAGRAEPEEMKSAYFWPVYGEQDEICFLYYPSRSAKHVYDASRLSPPAGAVLQTDGYAAYAQYAKNAGVTHAQCGAHSRRNIFDAQDIEPALAKEALDAIGALYVVEAQIRNEQLTGEAKRALRRENTKPVLKRFFAWIDQQFERQGFLPSSPFLGAQSYIRERRTPLSVYLDEPEISIDTNHLARALRVIPMGRRNWLFAWTKLGVKHVGIVQSLIVTCRLYDINPYDYFVDVLQRVGQHPASKVHELTPRLWKQLFADQPLRSDLYPATTG